MSYGSLVLFDTDGEIVSETEYHNGHGTGPAVWRAVHRRATRGSNYLFQWLSKAESYPGNVAAQYAAFLQDEVRHTPSRNLMLFTLLEPTIVPREQWGVLVSNILAVFRVSSLDKLDEKIAASGYVNHWGNIARTLHDRADDETLLGAGVYNTSINDYPFQGDYDPETETYGRFDPINDSWWLTPTSDPYTFIRAPHPNSAQANQE